MKALTISQPYAHLIATKQKWVENRSWKTNYRGELAVHAGKGLQYLPKNEAEWLGVGCVVAVGWLAACVHISEIIAKYENASTKNELVRGTNYTWAQIAEHDHTIGCWCWIIENVRECKRVAINGKQGLWTFDKSLIVW